MTTYGSPRILAELTKLGFEAELRLGGDAEFAVIPRFEVACGRFVGRIVDLGVPAPPDYPRTVGSSIHVRSDPPLLDYRDTQPNIRNIIASPLGPDWRYWSHNFQWAGQDRGARRLISQIHGIFSRA